LILKILIAIKIFNRIAALKK